MFNSLPTLYSGWFSKRNLFTFTKPDQTRQEERDFSFEWLYIIPGLGTWPRSRSALIDCLSLLAGPDRARSVFKYQPITIWSQNNSPVIMLIQISYFLRGSHALKMERIRNLNSISRMKWMCFEILIAKELKFLTWWNILREKLSRPSLKISARTSPQEMWGLSKISLFSLFQFFQLLCN